jgi:cytochrome c peroxidase
MLVIIVSCTNKKVTEKDRALLKMANEYFKPISNNLIDTKKNQDLIKLGKELYFEKKLSINNTISCNSCHNLDTYGVDNQATSPGHDGTRGDRNSPTTLNAAYHFRQFWDGRAKDLEEQALGPILNPIEHGLKNEKQALEKIKSPKYINAFKKASLDFKYKNIGVAIGAFEKTLITPSAFDHYLNGDIHALNDEQREGLETFIKVGCTSCHSGTILGGQSYQKIGLVKKYSTKDLGRYNVTKKRRDKYKFKVPGLRNIEKTAPYFHDGSIKTLSQAIQIMGEYQLGIKLTKKQNESIQSFLKALTYK